MVAEHASRSLLSVILMGLTPADSVPRIPVILGAAQLGAPGTGERVSDPAIVQDFIDLMLSHGQTGIDTSRIYAQGTSEKLIGTLDLRGVARVDTKIFPLAPGDHEPAKLKETFKICQEALGAQKIRVFYLHAPDRSVPYEDTLEALDEIKKFGGFEELGLSNFPAWEVAEVVGICKRRGFVEPSVYEGVYNIIDRSAEDELFPCLRKFGIRYAAYTPLAGGYLTNRFFLPDTTSEVPLSKFRASDPLSWMYKSRYLPAAQAVAELLEVVKAHGLTLAEVALRWLQWHSKLQPGDHGIIVAVSNRKQLEDNLADCEKGPLPEAVVQACEEAWKKARPTAPKYWI